MRFCIADISTILLCSTDSRSTNSCMLLFHGLTNQIRSVTYTVDFDVNSFHLAAGRIALSIFVSSTFEYNSKTAVR